MKAGRSLVRVGNREELGLAEESAGERDRRRRLLDEGASIEKINVIDHKDFAVKMGVVGLPFMALVDGGMLKRTILGPTSERRVRGLLAHSRDRTQAA